MSILNLRIAPRVGLAFGAVVLIIAVLSAVVLSGLSRSADNSLDMTASMLRQHHTGQSLLLAKDNAIASMVLLVSSSPDQQARLQREMAARDSRIQAHLQTLETGYAGDAPAKDLLAEARRRQGTYVAGVKRIVDMVLAGKQAEATFAADEEMIPMLAPFLEALARLDGLEAEQVRRLEQANTSLVQSTQWLPGGATLIAVVLAAAAGLVLVRSMTQPLAQALRLAERVADGDLTACASPKGQDELSQLLLTLNRMTRSLSDRSARRRRPRAAARPAGGRAPARHRAGWC